MKVAVRTIATKTGSFLAKKPWVSFFVFLILIFGTIFVGHQLRLPEPEVTLDTLPSKTVSIVSSSEAATITVAGQIKKASIIDITALAPGIVTSFNVRPGQKVSSGQILATLTNDYQSGASAIERTIASNNAALSESLAALTKDTQKLEAKRINKDSSLTGTQEEIALQNLQKEKEQRRVDLTNSQLSLQLALKNDAVLNPKALFPGTIQNILVRRGQFVNAGQKLMSFQASNDVNSTVEVSVTLDTFLLFNSEGEAVLTLNDGSRYPLKTLSVAKSESSDGLFSLVFLLPEELSTRVTEKQVVNVSLPLIAPENLLLLPIDSVVQEGDTAWVFVIQDGFAKMTPVKLGNVLGNFVMAENSLSPETKVITTRGIIQGEPVITE